MQYRYTLDRTSKKSLCPRCNKKKLVRYIDSETKNYLKEQFGRCDAQDSCRYFQKPTFKPLENIKSFKPPEPKPTIFIPFRVLQDTLKGYEDNNFVDYLKNHFEVSAITETIHKYKLGTITYEDTSLSGATTFPYIDKNENCRCIQIRKFDKQTGSGKGQKQSFIQWIHKQSKWFESYQQNEKKVSCLFGEHLLKQYPKALVLVVEAPKTAIVFSCMNGFNEILCLSCFNLSGLRDIKKFEVLKEREVVFIPDTSKTSSAYTQWSEDVENLNLAYGTKFQVSDYLETIVSKSQKNKGYDLADFMLKAS